MINDADSLFKAIPSRKEIEVDIPGSDEKITFKELSVSDRMDYVNLRKADDFSIDKLAAFVIVRACDFLDDTQVDAVEERFSPEVLAFFSGKILKMSGMLKSQLDEAEKK